MALTDEEYQQQIIADLGDPDGVLAPQVSRLWDLYEDLAAWPRRRYLRTKLHAITVLQGSVRDNPSFSVVGDLSVKLKERFDNLTTLYHQVYEELGREQGTAASVALHRPHRPGHSEYRRPREVVW